MIFKPNDDDQDNDNNDFFDGPDIPEPVKQPKKPTYLPEDPDYWEEEESEWEHLKPTNRSKMWLWIGAIVVLIALICAVWMRFLNPYVTDASQVGYVEHIEKRGTVFKACGGGLVRYKGLLDTTRVYRRDFIFTAADEKTAVRLKQAMIDGRPIRVSYKQYHAILPWRGSSKTIVTGVDSVDPTKILPPEFRISTR